MTRPVLVAGGAGYIGSHVVRRLLAAGRDVVVLDDLSTASHRGAGGPQFYVGDLFDPVLMGSILAEHSIETIIHTAASHHPIQRLSSTAAAFADLVKSGVSKLIFTSSCAVYGPARSGHLVDETCAAAPLNAYGAEKLALEQILLSLSRTTEFRCVALRCFNVAGAYHDDGFCGSPGDSSRLINMACQVAARRRMHVPVMGSDFPTRDGTCIRDYVHVDDVAAAHVNAVSYLDGGGHSVVLNCGSGRGYSVREVVRTVEVESGVVLPTRIMPHRSQDVPFMVASNRRIQETLGWVPRKSLFAVVRSALASERED